MVSSRLPVLAFEPLGMLPALALLAACASAPPTSAPEPAAAPASAPVSAPASASASASAPAPVSTPAASAAEEPSGPPDPAPLTADEQKEADKKCKPLMQAIQRAKGGRQSPLDALTAALKKPPPQLKAADLTRCADLLTRGIQTYLIAAKEVEAQVVLKRIGQAMADAYNENAGALCPSSEHPVPANRALVAKEPYVSTDADWSSPAWKCLHLNLSGQTQRFQYEVRVDPAQKTFDIIARGVPGARWVEIRQKGTVSNKGIAIGAIERR